MRYIIRNDIVKNIKVNKKNEAWLLNLLDQVLGPQISLDYTAAQSSQECVLSDISYIDEKLDKKILIPGKISIRFDDDELSQIRCSNILLQVLLHKNNDLFDRLYFRQFLTDENTFRKVMTDVSDQEDLNKALQNLLTITPHKIFPENAAHTMYLALSKYAATHRFARHPARDVATIAKATADYLVNPMDATVQHNYVKAYSRVKTERNLYYLGWALFVVGSLAALAITVSPLGALAFASIVVGTILATAVGGGTILVHCTGAAKTLFNTQKRVCNPTKPGFEDEAAETMPILVK